MNHRKDKHLESFEDNISFLQRELLIKNEIVRTITETQTAVLDTISTLQRILTGNKNPPDSPEIPSNTTIATHHQHQSQIQQQQPERQHQQ